MSESPSPLSEHTRQIAVTCLVVLALVAGVWALRWAAALLIPLVVSVLAAFALNPLVRALERVRIPRVLAAGMVMIGLLGGLGYAAWALSDEATEAAQHLPDASERIRSELRKLRDGEPGALDAIEEAAEELDAAASEAAGAAPPPRTEPPAASLGLRDWVVIGSMSMVAWSGQILLLVFLVFFLLASDDLFKRKFVRLAGPALSPRRVTVAMLDGIQASMEQFMRVTVWSNVGVAVGTWLAFSLYGLSGAPLWGLLGGLLNTIPYVGSTIAAFIFFVAALLQFDSFGDALVVGSIFVAITTTEGMIIKPWLIGRAAHINNVAVFTSLIFWGWVWGAWGLLLAYPILMVVKIVSDHSEPLAPIAELLGD